MPIADEITEKLEEFLDPRELSIRDDSERHRGHSGWREEGETHFHVRLRTKRFEGLTRIARHRAVHSALGPDLVSRIHALSLDLDV